MRDNSEGAPFSAVVIDRKFPDEIPSLEEALQSESKGKLIGHIRSRFAQPLLCHIGFQPYAFSDIDISVPDETTPSYLLTIKKHYENYVGLGGVIDLRIYSPGPWFDRTPPLPKCLPQLFHKIAVIHAVTEDLGCSNGAGTPLASPDGPMWVLARTLLEYHGQSPFVSRQPSSKYLDFVRLNGPGEPDSVDMEFFPERGSQEGSCDVWGQAASGPYGLRPGGIEEARKVRDVLFDGRGEDETDDWLEWTNLPEDEDSDKVWCSHFASGMEWWGVYCVSYWLPERGLLVVCCANETD